MQTGGFYHSYYIYICHILIYKLKIVSVRKYFLESLSVSNQRDDMQMHAHAKSFINDLQWFYLKKCIINYFSSLVKQPNIKF